MTVKKFQQKKALIRAFHSISPANLYMKLLIEKRHI
ncbi:hypothetical protein C621_0213810 [Bacillus thuringiensis serovar aizawai str. Leapi01]|nr:hypothetical protein C621_0213810 [Bacillus thuringiensis serovar aizawai str. Leapi01]ETE96801.1 hypothetical protein C623_0217990 [Bacillus thuringiensis serovar aizawai str. Hu4-2]QDD83792.1 hypothetical protein FORC087_2493 [Bacillus cereus]